MNPPDCYKCVYREDVPGDVHSQCVPPPTTKVTANRHGVKTDGSSGHITTIPYGSLPVTPSRKNMSKYTSPAIIQKPLRYIRNRTAIRNDKGEITGYEPIYYIAEEIAKEGNNPKKDVTLQMIARGL